MNAAISAAPTPAGVHVRPLPAFRDNYIWLLEREGHAVVVDPGDAAPVLNALAEQDLTLDAIVVTHHHADHVGGVTALVAAHGAPVYGPQRCPFPGIDHRLAQDDHVTLLGLDFTVLDVPGHTLDHIAYWSPALQAVFCGDTLFAGGCGRVFEGTPAQMHASLARLAALPETTAVYCAHEYTSANLAFARAVEPGNAALQQRSAHCAELRAQGLPTVPSLMGLERATNPFLRCAEPAVRAAASAQLAAAPGAAQAPAFAAADAGAVAVFAAVRAWKDNFRA